MISMFYLNNLSLVWIYPTLLAVIALNSIRLIISIFNDLSAKNKNGTPLAPSKDKTQQKLIEFNIYFYKEVSP